MEKPDECANVLFSAQGNQTQNKDQAQQVDPKLGSNHQLPDSCAMQEPDQCVNVSLSTHNSTFQTQSQSINAANTGSDQSLPSEPSPLMGTQLDDLSIIQTKMDGLSSLLAAKVLDVNRNMAELNTKTGRMLSSMEQGRQAQQQEFQNFLGQVQEAVAAMDEQSSDRSETLRAEMRTEHQEDILALREEN